MTRAAVLALEDGTAWWGEAFGDASAASGEVAAEQIVPEAAPPSGEFVASSAKKTSKYHRATCNSVRNLADDARVWFATRAEAEAAGLQACKLCRKK